MIGLLKNPPRLAYSRPASRRFRRGYPLSRSILAASKNNRERYPGREISLSANALERIDHVLIGKDSRYLFAVEGSLQDPAHKRVVVEVQQAIRTPIEQSDSKLEAAKAQIAQKLHSSRQQQQQRQPAVERLN